MTKESSYTLLQSKKWRAITYNWDVLSDYGNTGRLYCLTDFQVAWLLSNTQYMRWSSRWTECPCTPGDLDKMAAEMEYNLMSCTDLQPWQLAYLYKEAQEAQLNALDDLWDGVNPSSVNPDTPDDFYSGDGSVDRENALCTACKIYVYSYAESWVTKAQIALGIAVVVGLAASITLVGGAIATVLVGGLAFVTQTALDAMTDEEALDNVVCCMFNALNGAVINQANFENCLDTCGFTVGSNEAIIRDIIGADLDKFGNWLTFISQVGDSYVFAAAGVSDCPCDDSWIWTSDFDVTENIWGVFSGFGSWALSTGYSTVDANTGSGGYSRIVSITSGNFSPTYIGNFSVNYDLTKGSYSLGGQATVQLRFYRDDDSFVVQNLVNTSAVNGVNQTYSMTIDEPDIKRLELYIRSSAQGSPSYSGSAKLNYVTVNGEGFNPFA